MGAAMCYSPIYTILLVVIHSSKNTMEKVDGLLYFGWNSAQPDGKQFSNLIILCMVEV